MRVFQADAFQADAFSDAVEGAITQAGPAFTQLAQAFLEAHCDDAFQSGAFQADGFQVCLPIDIGTIHQSLPAFTQSGSGTVGVVIEIHRGVGVSQKLPVHGGIVQVMPAFTQRLYANVNDDEFVLLLI